MLKRTNDREAMLKLLKSKIRYGFEVSTPFGLPVSVTYSPVWVPTYGSHGEAMGVFINLAGPQSEHDVNRSQAPGWVVELVDRHAAVMAERTAIGLRLHLIVAQRWRDAWDAYWAEADADV